MKYYAVRKGKKTGIYTTWEECKKQVHGYSSAEYKSFATEQEAENFINPKQIKNLNFSQINEIIAYVDGSYIDNIYGSGVVLIKDNEIIHTISQAGENVEMLSMWNVSGEIIASMLAIQYAVKNNYNKITIYYDYEGIEKWANHKWKTKKKGTIAYQNFIDKYRNKIIIGFTKVKAHSNNEYNDMADKLAKESIKNIKEFYE